MSPLPAYPDFARAIDALAIPPDVTVLVAVSGGPDSTALLALFAELRSRRRRDLRIRAGHVHHGLRGAEADADLHHAGALCDTLGIPLSIARVDTREHRRARRVSLETAARELRLACFAAWARELDLHAVATGHTREDQAETILGNVIRGTGLRGLRGMPSSRPLEGAEPALLIRPLLELDQSDLELFRHACELGARMDASNADPAHRRNRIRGTILPLLRRENPRIVRALNRLAGEANELFGARSERLTELVTRLRTGPGLVALRLRRSEGIEESLLAPLLDEIWARAQGSTTGLTRDHHDRWRQFVRGGHGKCYDLPRGWRLERVGEWLYLMERRSREQPVVSRPLPLTGVVELDWIPARLVVSEAPTENRAPRESLSLPRRLWVADPARAPCVRSATRKDRIRLRCGTASIFAMLRDGGVPTAMRARYPVVEARGEVVGVPPRRSAWARSEPGPMVDIRLEVPAVSSREAFVLTEVVGAARPPHPGR